MADPHFISGYGVEVLKSKDLIYLGFGLVEDVAGHVPEGLLLLVELGGQHGGVRRLLLQQHG